MERIACLYPIAWQKCPFVTKTATLFPHPSVAFFQAQKMKKCTHNQFKQITEAADPRLYKIICHSAVFWEAASCFGVLMKNAR